MEFRVKKGGGVLYIFLLLRLLFIRCCIAVKGDAAFLFAGEFI